MDLPRALGLGLALCLPLAAARAGGIRPGAEMGPRARRILAGMAAERTQRDLARERRVRASTAAVVRVRSPGLGPEVAEEVARVAGGKLRACGFKVRPFAAVRERVERLGEDLLGSDVTLRQLCRRLRAGVLVQVSVLAYQLGSAQAAGFALPSHWSEAQRSREMGEVHLRLQIYEEEAGRITRDRQDRQWSFVPAAPAGVTPARTQVLEELLGRALDHLLAGLAPGLPSGEGGPGGPVASGSGLETVAGPVEVEGDQHQLDEHRELDREHVQHVGPP